MTHAKLSLSLKNELAELDQLSASLKEFGATIGLPPKILFNVNLALEELICNIITHGYPENGSHQIELSIEYRDHTLTIFLEDDGIPFNPLHARCANRTCILKKRQIGGLGVQIARSMMDDIGYQRCGTKNRLILKKFITP